MSCVALPLFAVAGERGRLRSMTESLLGSADGRWPAVLDAVPIVRALAAAGAPALLARTGESLRSTPGLAGSAETALLTADGLLALKRGDPAEAVECRPSMGGLPN